MRLATRRRLTSILVLVLLAVAVIACADDRGGADVPAAQAMRQATQAQQFEQLLAILGNPSAPPEMRVMAAQVLAELDPVESVDPLVAMLAAEDPRVLVAVIENLPHAAEEIASSDLELLRDSYPEPEVQAAARARLDEFAEFDQ